MWTTITQKELRRVKAELAHDHFQLDVRHAEEREALRKRQEHEAQELDLRITRIEQLERQIEAFIEEYAGSCGGEIVVEQASRTPTEVEVVATWAKTKFGSRAA